MSAVAGVFRFDHASGAEDMLARILRPLEPFGRDAGDSWAGGSVALGRRLTRLLPEDALDQQPLHCAAQQLSAVAIGRIENRGEIEAALGLRPEQWRNLSDGALAFEAWKRWGEAALDRLHGPLTLAVWDGRSGQLICARSPPTAPPLYWHRGDGFFAFAGAPSALHALPQVPRKLDEHRLARFLVRRPDASEGRLAGSFFEGIERLAPGHLVRVSAEGVAQVRRFWSLAERPDVRLASDTAYAEALREHLDRAIGACLRSVSPVGSHLSSGRDSSAVMASAAIMLAERGQRLAAFTGVPRADFEASAFFRPGDSEASLAREAASRYPNVDHVLVHNAPQKLLETIAGGHRLYNRPMGAAFNMVWAEAIRDAARGRGIRVLLTGGFGNLGLSEPGLGRLGELAAGGHLPTLLNEMRLLRRGEGMTWRLLLHYALPYEWTAFLRRASGKPQSWDGRRWSAGSPALLARPLRSIWTRGWDNPRTQLPDALLSVDAGDAWNGAIAGWGIDERDPTANRRLLEFCHGIPSEQFLAQGRTRAIYRRAFASRLPAAILDARRKAPQSADWPEGMIAIQSELPSRLESLKESPLASRLLDLPRLERLAGEWTADPAFAERRPEYASALVTALAVGDFIRWAEGRNR